MKTLATLLLVLQRQWWVDVRWESPVSCLLKGSCNLMVDPKRVSVIQCDVTESVILSDRYRGVTVPSCEIKRRGFSGTKGFCSR